MTGGQVNLNNQENWANMLNAGASHNFMSAAKISGLDKYLKPKALEALANYGGEVEVSRGKIRFLIDGKEVDSDEIDQDTLEKMWEVYDANTK